MPTLRDIRLRIRGVQNTQKITRSMKTMALVRIQKQEQRTRNSRAFTETVHELLSRLGMVLSEEETAREPYFTLKESGPELLVVFTSDRGLCGNFNSNILRAVDQEMEAAHAEGRKIELICVGLKAAQHAERRKYPIRARYVHLPADPSVDISSQISAECQKAYLQEGTREVYLLYNHFVSIMKRDVRKLRFLPAEQSVYRQKPGDIFPLYIFEPSPLAILEQLLPLYLETIIFQTLLESNASEHAARMVTMDQATNNAASLLEDLTLVYHKARQATITRELVEIVSGAEAL